MIQIRDILVPLDLSDYARHALGYARELAPSFGARLHLLHAVDSHWLVTGSGAFPELGGDLLARLTEEGESALAKISGELAGDLDVVTCVRIGPPHVQVVQYAREHGIDLIVLATHGRSGLHHALIGSVAEKVVQMAPCPVLTVKHPEHEFILP